MKFRALEPHEIEVRVSRCTKNGAFFLLYKDARCDQSILDETVGEMGWQRRHEEHKGNLFCSVGIRDWNTGEWVWKEDAGSESNTEAEKGHASDSFKRSCFNWGIGRELYTKINIFIKGLTKDSGKKDKYGRPIYELEDPYIKFHVSAIDTDNEEKKIKYLQISDANGSVAFEWGNKPDYRCCVCGKEIYPAIYTKSMRVNGKPYCSGTCKSKDGAK